jgi:hypothetical protein
MADPLEGRRWLAIDRWRMVFLRVGKLSVTVGTHNNRGAPVPLSPDVMPLEG